MYRALVVLAVFAASLAQMALKRGAMGGWHTFRQQYLNPWTLGGYAVLAATLLGNVFCLSRGVRVNQIAALESLGYLFVSLLARFFFREPLTGRKLLAIATVMAGVVVFFS